MKTERNLDRGAAQRVLIYDIIFVTLVKITNKLVEFLFSMVTKAHAFPA